MKKKLMLLGGIYYLVPVIEAAHKLGIHVITADYLPDNVAHKYSDEYVNVSIIDKEAVLSVAKEKNIDGILSFAVDPGVTTAAYVAEKMGIPAAGPSNSVEILQNKSLFRAFLKQNGFNVPIVKSYKDKSMALQEISTIPYPCIVKPVDSAGSKGVTRVDSPAELEKAIDQAQLFSIHSSDFIIEEFIEPLGTTSDADSFVVNGKLAFVSFDNQLFDKNAPNPFTPAAYSWPSSMSNSVQEYLTSEIQRLIDLLQMRTSVFNIECRIGKNGTPYLMEVSPRGGGNRLSEMVRYAYGIDMIECAVKAAVGMNFEIDKKSCNGYWGNVILHSNKTGKLKSVEVLPELERMVVDKTLFLNSGVEVRGFNGANDTVGTMFIHFDNKDIMDNYMRDVNRLYNVEVE